MAEPTVKVKVVVDDSEAQQKISALGDKMRKAFADVTGRGFDFGPVGKQVEALGQSFDNMGKKMKQAADDIAALNKSMGELEKKATRPKKELTGFAKTLDDAKRGFNNAQKAIFAFNNTMFAVQTVLNIVRNVAQATWDTMKEGAVINTTTAAFERLSSTLIGVPDLLNQLQAASRGTINDLSLMQQTLSLVQGAAPELARSLGQAAPALLEVARASAILNPALGTAEQNYARLALGIRRSSVRILDDIGLVIKLQDAYDKFAEKTNQSVKELDAQEKQLALLAETLAQGENLLNALGDSATSQVDSFQQLEAAWTNFTNKMKASLADTFVPVIRALSGDFKLAMESAVASAAEGPVREDVFANIISGALDARDALKEYEEATNAAEIAAQSFTAVPIDPDVGRNMSGFNEALGDFIRLGAEASSNASEFLIFMQRLDGILGKDFELEDFFSEVAAGLGTAAESAEDFAAGIRFLQNAGMLAEDSFEGIVTGAARATDSTSEFYALLRQVVDLEEVARQRGPAVGVGVTEAESIRAGMQLVLSQIEELRAAAVAVEQGALRAKQAAFVAAGGLDGLGESAGMTEDELADLQKAWDAIDFGKGMPEDVARLAVSLGQITPEAAKAAVAAHELEESIDMLVDKGDEFTNLTGDQMKLALFALNEELVNSADQAIRWAQVTTSMGGPIVDVLLAAADAMVQAATASGELTASWTGIDLGSKGVADNVAALNVALGAMTQAEADAAVAAFNLHANFDLLAQQADFAKLTTEQQALALYALQFGLVDTATAAIATGVAMSKLSDAEKQAALDALRAAAGFNEVNEAVKEVAKAVADAAAEILKSKGATGELAAEFIKAAAAAGATSVELYDVAAATGLLTDAELEALAATSGLAQKQADLLAAVQAGTMTFGQAVAALLAYAQAANVAGASIGSLADATRGFGTFVSELNASLGGGGGGGGGLLDSLGTFRDTFIESLSGIADAQEKLDEAIEKGETEEKIKELTDELGKASGATRNWKKELFDLTIEAGASVEQIIALGLATGVLTEQQAQAAFKQAAAAAAIEKLAQAYVAGSISAEEAAAAVGSVQEAIASGGDIDLSQFGIDVGNLATQTARAGQAAGGAARETRNWRDDLLDLADAEETTAQQALELARQTGKFSEEQLASALQADFMSKQVEILGEVLGDLSVDQIVTQLENLQAVIGQLSADELALFLDLGLEFELTPAELNEAIRRFIQGQGDLTIEEAINIVLKANVEVETNLPAGIGGGPIDLAEIPTSMLRGGALPGVTGGQAIAQEVQINVVADKSQADQAITDVAGALAALAEQTTTTNLDADTSDAESALADITGDLTAYDAATYTSTADLDTGPASSALAEFVATAEATTVTIPVEFEIGSVPTPTAPVPDDTASRGARVLPGDVILVGDSGRSDPSELFVTDEYLASGGRNNNGINAPRVIGSGGPSFFEASTAGFVLPYVPSSFDSIMALADMIRARDGGDPVGGPGFGNLEDLSFEGIIDALRNGARWSVEDFLRTGRFEFFPTVYDAYSRRGKPRYAAPPGGFSEGGYTGEAGGIVHGHEFVFNPTATSNLGIDTLEALHAAANSSQGLAEALGLVDPSLFGLPLSTYDRIDHSDDGRSSVNNSLTINVANAKDARIITRRELGAIV